MSQASSPSPSGGPGDPSRRPERVCVRGHALEKFVTPCIGTCDGCGEMLEASSEVIDCRRCNWFLCASCAQKSETLTLDVGSSPAAGEYELLSDTAGNGMPIWKMRGGEWWLFSSPGRVLYVGGPEEQKEGFRCDRGVLRAGKKGRAVRDDSGKLFEAPALDPVTTPWSRNVNGEWKEDAQITVRRSRNVNGERIKNNEPPMKEHELLPKEVTPTSAAPPRWDATLSHCIGASLGNFDGKVEILDAALYDGVTAAVDALASGRATCQAGKCAVYSKTKAEYFLLYRSDVQDIVYEEFNLKHPVNPPPPTPPPQLTVVLRDIKQGPEGEMRFTIEVQSTSEGSRSGTVSHRYSEFVALKSALRVQVPVNLPRKTFRRPSDSGLEERRRGLEAWLTSAIGQAESLQDLSRPLRNFLSSEDEQNQ